VRAKERTQQQTTTQKQPAVFPGFHPRIQRYKLCTTHFEQVELQLSRELRPLPQMKINPEVKSIFDFKISDFELINYDPHPHIKGEVAV
jgi:hypothetical protein